MKLTVEENEAKKVNDKALHSDQAIVEDHDEQGATGQTVGSNVAAVVR